MYTNKGDHMFVNDAVVEIRGIETLTDVVLDKIYTLLIDPDTDQFELTTSSPISEVLVVINDEEGTDNWELDLVQTYFGLPDLQWEAIISRPSAADPGQQREYVKIVSSRDELTAVQALATVFAFDHSWKTPYLGVINLLSR